MGRHLGGWTWLDMKKRSTQLTAMEFCDFKREKTQLYFCCSNEVVLEQCAASCGLTAAFS